MSEIVCIFLFNRLSEHLKSGLHQERSNTRVWVVPLPWQMAKACPGGSARAESTAQPPRDGAAWGSFPCPTPFLCVGSNAVALLSCRGNKICSLVSSQRFCVWISWRNPLHPSLKYLGCPKMSRAPRLETTVEAETLNKPQPRPGHRKFSISPMCPQSKSLMS